MSGHRSALLERCLEAKMKQRLVHRVNKENVRRRDDKALSVGDTLCDVVKNQPHCHYSDDLIELVNHRHNNGNNGVLACKSREEGVCQAQPDPDKRNQNGLEPIVAPDDLP